MLSVYHQLCHRYYLAHGATYHEAVVEGTPMRYYRMGQGPHKLMMVHGLGDNAWSWRVVAGQLAKRAQLIIPHLPGFGDSPLPGGEPLPFSRYRQLLRGFADQVTPDPHHVVGLSMGGWLASLLALEAPANFPGVVLVNPGGARTPDLETTAIRFRDFVSTERGSTILRQLTHRPPAYWHLITRDIERIFRGPVVQTLMHSMQEEDFLTDEAIRRLPASSTLILGDRDVFLPLGTGEFFKSHFPGQVINLPNTGHLPPLERPRQLARAIAQHLGQEAPGPQESCGKPYWTMNSFS